MDNQNLEKRIQALEKWQKERKEQQIFFPLDIKSLDILRKYFMHIVSTFTWQAGVGGNTFLEYIGRQGSTEFSVSPPSLVTYTVDVTTNYLTTNQISGNLKFFDDQGVVLFTDGTAPNPLDAGLGTVYYVINSDGYYFQLTTISGDAGSIVNITNTGSGRQFITYA